MGTGALLDFILVVATPLSHPSEPNIFTYHPYLAKVLISHRYVLVSECFVNEILHLGLGINRCPPHIHLGKEVNLTTTGPIVGLTIYSIGIVVEAAVEASVIHIRRDVIIKFYGKSPSWDNIISALAADIIPIAITPQKHVCRAPSVVGIDDEIADSGLVILTPVWSGAGVVGVNPFRSDNCGGNVSRNLLIP